MKRIIRDIPTKMHLISQAVLYDGMEDMIVDDDFNHTGALYVSIMTPVFEDLPDESGELVRTMVAKEKVLIEPDKRIKKRHTFGGWNAVGEDVPLPKVNP